MQGKIRVRPRTRETVLADEYGRRVPYDNADGTLGILVDEHSPFWARRLRDKDAVIVADETAPQDKPAAKSDAGERK